MWHHFPYSGFRDPGQAVIFRPVLQFELVHGNATLSSYGIIDTGADYCFFPINFAYQLGLDPLSTVPTNTIGVGNGGQVPTYQFDVVLNINPLGKFQIRAGFIESLNTIGMGLLGHRHFIDELKILFNRKDGVFSIER